MKKAKDLIILTAFIFSPLLFCPLQANAQAPHPLQTKEGTLNLQHRFLNTAKNVTLHYVEGGNPTGPVMLFLHGFPEFWYSWRHQLVYWGKRGYRVVAPDLRGYNLSSKPPAIKAYELGFMANDIAVLIKHLGAPKITLVAHDFGVLVTSVLVQTTNLTTVPAITKIIIMNGPHPQFISQEAFNILQLFKSWYVLFFQIPVAPEAALNAVPQMSLKYLLQENGTAPQAYSDADLALYQQAMTQPGAMRAMLNGYRALVRKYLIPSADTKLAVSNIPTLILWGDKDQFIRPELADGFKNFFSDLKMVHFPEASHWIQNEIPQKVNQHMLSFVNNKAKGY